MCLSVCPCVCLSNDVRILHSVTHINDIHQTAMLDCISFIKSLIFAIQRGGYRWRRKSHTLFVQPAPMSNSVDRLVTKEPVMLSHHVDTGIAADN